jgi:osmC family protein
VDRLIQLSEQKDCTVSRTVEHPTKVSFHNLAD